MALYAIDKDNSQSRLRPLDASVRIRDLFMQHVPVDGDYSARAGETVFRPTVVEDFINAGLPTQQFDTQQMPMSASWALGITPDGWNPERAKQLAEAIRTPPPIGNKVITSGAGRSQYGSYQRFSLGNTVAMTSYASRLWACFARAADDTTSSSARRIYYTRAGHEVLSSEAAKFFQCYARYSPIDPDTAVLLDTDGGWIEVPAEVIALWPARDALIVFTTDGVFAVLSQGGGMFLPTSYTIDRVADTVLHSKWAVCGDGNDVYFLSDRGIVNLSPDPQSGRFAASVLSRGSVDTICTEMRKGATVAAKYFEEDNTARFLYGLHTTEIVFNVASITSYTKELVANTATRAFYTMSYENELAEGRYVMGYVDCDKTHVSANAIGEFETSALYLVLSLDESAPDGGESVWSACAMDMSDCEGIVATYESGTITHGLDVINSGLSVDVYTYKEEGTGCGASAEFDFNYSTRTDTYSAFVPRDDFEDGVGHYVVRTSVPLRGRGNAYKYTITSDSSRCIILGVSLNTANNMR